MSDFTVLSVLERRHIIETVEEAVRVIREETEAHCLEQMNDHDTLIEDLQEVLRILGADDVEE